MRLRPGFTLMELMMVLVLATVVLAAAIPRMSRSLAQLRLQRAATVVSADLRLAHSLAARQRAPVTIAIDTAAKIFRIRDVRTPANVFSERRMDRSSAYPVQRIIVDRTSLVVYPNGLASNGVSITLIAGGRSRMIRMSRAGQVRVSAP
jgi:prepilin-type N-terminal cleavage/methylation domain-containing protein